MREYGFGAALSIGIHLFALYLISSAEIEPPRYSVGREASFAVELVTEEPQGSLTVTDTPRAPAETLRVAEATPPSSSISRAPSKMSQPAIRESRKVTAVAEGGDRSDERSVTSDSGSSISDTGSPGSDAGTLLARPDYLRNPRPRYPASARRAGQEGVVEILVRVGASGDAEEVSVHRSSGYAALDSAALGAVRDWRFSPAMRGGLPTPSTVVVPVKFQLER